MRLYVGNLSYQTTDDTLREHFAQAGNVTNAQVIRDKMTGRSRGFGFVEMDDADGKKAVDALNGKDFEGRPLVVNEAKPMEARAPRGGNGGGYSQY